MQARAKDGDISLQTTELGQKEVSLFRNTKVKNCDNKKLNTTIHNIKYGHLILNPFPSAIGYIFLTNYTTACLYTVPWLDNFKTAYKINIIKSQQTISKCIRTKSLSD